MRLAAPGAVMRNPSLIGRSILIVEDEPLIALDIAAEFEKFGANVLAAYSLAEATDLVEHDGLAAAVMDFGLGDGNAEALCARLNELSIPFVLHSGYIHHGAGCNGGLVVPKPAHPAAVIAGVCQLLTSRQP